MIALYKGLSPLSRAIKFLNWSDYSHAAWVSSLDGKCTEAWASSLLKLEGSVITSPSFDTIHTKGSEVDFYEVKDLKPHQERFITDWIRAKNGAPYDFRGIFKFLSRGMNCTDGRWFCSELVFTACQMGGVSLLNLPAWKVYPGMLAYSPLLRFVETRICGGG